MADPLGAIAGSIKDYIKKSRSADVMEQGSRYAKGPSSMSARGPDIVDAYSGLDISHRLEHKRPQDMVIAVTGEDNNKIRSFIRQCNPEAFPKLLPVATNAADIFVYTYCDSSLDRTIYLAHIPDTSVAVVELLFRHCFVNGVLLLRSGYGSNEELTRTSLSIFKGFFGRFYGERALERVSIATASWPGYRLDSLDALIREQEEREPVNAEHDILSVLAAPLTFGLSLAITNPILVASRYLGKPKTPKRNLGVPAYDLFQAVVSSLERLGEPAEIAQERGRSLDGSGSTTGHYAPVKGKPSDEQPPSPDLGIELRMENLKLSDAVPPEGPAGAKQQYVKQGILFDDIPDESHESDMPGENEYANKMPGSTTGLFPRPPQSKDLSSDRGGESDSSGDFGMSWDYSPPLEEGNPVSMTETAAVKNSVGAVCTRQNGAGQEPAKEQDSRNNDFTPTAPTRPDSGNIGKRKISPRGEEGDGDPPFVEGTQKKARTAPRRLTFACPFCKKDPLRYRTCYRYTLSRVRDVKQHVARCHKLPIYCPSCMDTFPTTPLRDEHSRARACPTRPVVLFDGVTEEQKQQLARRISSRACEEDQWYTVFDILFPGHPRPASPYIDQQLSEEMHVFRDFMASEGPRIMRPHLEPYVRWLNSDPDTDMGAFQDHILGQCLQRVFEEWEMAMSTESPGQGSDTGSLPSDAASVVNHSGEIGETEAQQNDAQPASLPVERGSDTFSWTDLVCTPATSESFPERPFPLEASAFVPDPQDRAGDIETSERQPRPSGLEQPATNETTSFDWNHQFVGMPDDELSLQLHAFDTQSMP